MKFFIDTGKAQIRKRKHRRFGWSYYKSIIDKEGITGKNSILKHYVDICNLVEGDVSAEVNALDYDGMIKEGKN
jgi:transaldolase